MATAAKRVIHIVCFKFKPDTPLSVHQSMTEAAEALPRSLTDISFSLHFRPTFKHERAKGYTHVLHAEFSSREDLQTYSSHPQHVQFVEKYKPNFEDVMAVDIEI